MSQTSPPQGRPGRYDRSIGGLVGAMIVMVVVVVLAWLGLGLFREDAEFEPTPIDYDASVQALADSGAALAYPAEVPEGWRVNNLDPGPPFSLALLTDEQDFAGVYHGREELDEVLERLVDDSVEEQEPVQLTDGEGVLTSWQVYTDEGGDTAYVRVGDQQRDPLVTMVYGSAPAEELRGLVEILRTTS